MGRRCYVLLRCRYDVPTRRRGEVPLRRLGDVPSRPRWVVYLGRTFDVVGTYRETSLRRRHDVLMPGVSTLSLALSYSKFPRYWYNSASKKFICDATIFTFSKQNFMSTILIENSLT